MVLEFPSLFGISHNLLCRLLNLINIMPQLLGLCNPPVDIGGAFIADLPNVCLDCNESAEDMGLLV